MKNTKHPLCIKLDKDIRDKFKRITHDRETTMQSVLKAFVSFYIINPESISIHSNSMMTISPDSVDAGGQNESV